MAPKHVLLAAAALVFPARIVFTFSNSSVGSFVARLALPPFFAFGGSAGRSFSCSCTLAFLCVVDSIRRTDTSYDNLHVRPDFVFCGIPFFYIRCVGYHIDGFLDYCSV